MFGIDLKISAFWPKFVRLQPKASFAGQTAIRILLCLTSNTIMKNSKKKTRNRVRKTRKLLGARMDGPTDRHSDVGQKTFFRFFNS